MRTKSAKRKEILLQGDSVKIHWVGPTRPNDKWDAYMRLEGRTGNYLGALSKRQMRTVQRWLNNYFEDAK